MSQINANGDQNGHRTNYTRKFYGFGLGTPQLDPHLSSSKPNEVYNKNPIISVMVSAWRQFMVRILSFSLADFVQKMLSYVLPDFNDQSPQNSVLFDEDDSMEKLFGSNRGGDKFLGKYTNGDLKRMVMETPIPAKLEKLGLSDWYIELDLSDCFSHYAYIRLKSIEDRDRYVAFLIVNVGQYQLPEKIRSHLPMSVNLLYIRWLALQNPLGAFKGDKHKFPAQKYPGSGCARDAFALICKYARIAERDGLVNMPEHFHNAYLYKGFSFVDPEVQGRFQKMCKDLNQDILQRGLSLVSWAILLGFLRCDGQEVRWSPSEQVFPLTWKMWTYFKTPFFSLKVSSVEKTAGKYSINWDDAEHFCLSAIIKAQAST